MDNKRKRTSGKSKTGSKPRIGKSKATDKVRNDGTSKTGGKSYTSNKSRPEKESKPVSKPWANDKPKSKLGKRIHSSKNHNKPQPPKIDDGLTRLNKYIANTGVCSRREADVLIESGVVSVNGKVITQLGTKIGPDDIVNYGGQTLRRETLKYLILNKPKDYITTTDDPQKRKTVMNLIDKACKERIYPVGRLDRMTTGVLLFTNDGDLAKKLTHPKHDIKKIYHVQAHKNVTKTDLKKLIDGVKLEDGIAQVDNIAYVGNGQDKKQIGLEIHSGKNRIVRRMFEAIGYTVVRLDRVTFAGLTKKDVPRGTWRFLTEKEVGFLKML